MVKQYGQYSSLYISIFYGQLNDIFTIVSHNGQHMDVIRPNLFWNNAYFMFSKQHI